MSLNRFSHISPCVALALTVAWFTTTPVQAHSGRRLDVMVLGNQLFAQGYLSPGVPDDGGGALRPYYNSLHDHWHNVTGSVAVADLPGFDVLTPGPLAGHNLVLTLLGGSKWVSPPTTPAPGTIPVLEPLGLGETIDIEHDSISVDTDSLGSLSLATNIDPGGAEDLDMLYAINLNPSDVLYVLEWRLSTDAPGILDSSTVYTVLSPDGANPTEKLHLAALYLEGYLGVVPEPSSLVLLTLGMGAIAIVTWRRKRSNTSA